MMVVGENLRRLMEQLSISGDSSFDDFSISLSLDHNYYAPKGGVTRPIDYNRQDVDDFFESKKISKSGLTLGPSHAVIACSHERISIPLGYFGLLQTKGSLARLFCSIHMCDGQIEPGFNGRITFEIVNTGPFAIRLFPKDNIAQLFIFTCSTSNTRAYNGRYNSADGPTLMRVAK